MKRTDVKTVLILCLALAFLAACSRVVDPARSLPPRKQGHDSQTLAAAGSHHERGAAETEGGAVAQENRVAPGTMRSTDLVLSAKINHLNRENNDLKSGQAELQSKIATLTTQLEQEREEQQEFREMMETNFDLLEQSVARSLSGQIASNRVANDATVPPAQPKAERIAPPTPRSPAGRIEAPREVLPPRARTTREGAAEPVIRTTQAGQPIDGPRRSAARGRQENEVLTPLPVLSAQRESESFEDPDLIPPVNPIVLSAIPEAKPLYERGFVHYAKGKFEESIRVYEEFLSRFGNDAHADNAQFWIGEANFRLQRYEASEAAYRQVLRNYEHKSTLEGFKTPDAIYRLGHIYLTRNRIGRAQYYFSNAARRFPESTSGRKSRRELDAIEVDTALGQGRPEPNT